MRVQQKIANVLLDIGAVGFALKEPITFKSGIKSPVYVDNRIFPFHPDEWEIVIEGFQTMMHEAHISFDVVAGIETAGIPHSAVLGYELKLPSVFVRKATKDHGTKKMVEGGDVTGKRVVLIEDHVTTGESSLHGVRELRAAGATVEDCMAITTYGFAEGADAFAAQSVRLTTLTTFEDILYCARQRAIITEEQSATVQAWLANPRKWTAA